MDIKQTQKELSIILKSSPSVNKTVLKKYNDRLLREIRKNPDNIEAYSLLSIVKLELLCNTKIIIKYLKRAINSKSINNKQYAVLATNIAYILMEEPLDDNSPKEAFDYLIKAVKRKSAFPETYYGLGLYFYKNNDLTNALKHLKIATELSNDEKYAKAYTVCLITDGQYDNALHFVNLISEKPLNLLLSAVIAFHKKDYTKAKQLLDSINEHDCDDYSYKIAELYLSVGKYQKFTDYIDSEKYLFDKELAHKYAFAMNKLGKSEKANKKLHLLIEENNEIISDADVSDFASKKDYNRFIQDMRNETEEIIDGFGMAEIDPEYTFGLKIDTECYYIGCPRHAI